MPGKTYPQNLDLICANDVSLSTQGFNSDSNALHLFWQDGDKVLPLERKELRANTYWTRSLPVMMKKSTLRFWTRALASNFRCQRMPPPALPVLTCAPVSMTP